MAGINTTIEWKTRLCIVRNDRILKMLREENGE